MENLQKNKRGRLSKIELLPEKIKRKLDKMLSHVSILRLKF